MKIQPQNTSYGLAPQNLWSVEGGDPNIHLVGWRDKILKNPQLDSDSKTVAANYQREYMGLNQRRTRIYRNDLVRDRRIVWESLGIGKSSTITLALVSSRRVRFFPAH